MGVPVTAQRKQIRLRNHEVAGLFPGLAQWVKDHGVAVSCGVDRRGSSDLMWLWLWCRRTAVAQVQPLAWKLPYARGAALKKAKKAGRGVLGGREREREK